MIVWGEANGVAVAIAPREGFDRVGQVIQSRAQDGTVTDTLSHLTRVRVEERFYGFPFVRRIAEEGVAGRGHLGRSNARDEHIVAQRDVLARDVCLTPLADETAV